MSLLENIIPDPAASIVHDENGEVALDCFMVVSIVYDASIPLYYLSDNSGSIIQKIEVKDMPTKWRKFFEKDVK